MTGKNTKHSLTIKQMTVCMVICSAILAVICCFSVVEAVTSGSSSGIAVAEAINNIRIFSNN